MRLIVVSFALASAVGSVSVLAGCGVRGKPQPPLTPPELGRGQPTYKRATEPLAFPNVPSPESTPDANSSGRNRSKSGGDKN